MTSGTTKKKQKQQAVVSSEFTEKEKIYNQELERIKKELKSETTHFEQFKKNAILKLGNKLEKLGLVPKEKISSKIASDLKGYVSNSYPAIVANQSGKQWVSVTKPRSRGGKRSEYSDLSTETGAQTSLTGAGTAIKTPEEIAQEDRETQRAAISKKIIQDNFDRLDLMNKLITNLTGLSDAQQGQIGRELTEGADWRTEIVERSREHRFKMIKQMSESDLNSNLGTVQTLYQVVNDFMQKLYTELEIKRANKDLVQI